MAAQYIRVGNTLTNIIDSITGESVNYDLVTTWWDGTPMDDSKTDGTIYRKLGTEYFKRIYTGVIDVKWFGVKPDGVTDYTSRIQLALNITSLLKGSVLEFRDGDYVVDATFNNNAGLIIPSNVTIRTSTGTRFIAKATSSSSYSIFTIDQGSNIKINSLTLVGDRDNHIGTTGEHGMGISIRSSTDVTIDNIYVTKCWGDGIYIGQSNTSLLTNTNLILKNVYVADCRRQGVSVITANGLFINNMIVGNISGTAPAAAVDFEPNFPYQVLKNINVDNFSTFGLSSSSLLIALARYTIDSEPVSMNFGNLNFNSRFSIPGLNFEGNISTGIINVDNLVFTDNPSDCIRLDNYYDSPDLNINKATFINTNRSNSSATEGACLRLINTRAVTFTREPSVIFGDLNFQFTIPMNAYCIFIVGNTGATRDNVRIKGSVNYTGVTEARRGNFQTNDLLSIGGDKRFSKTISANTVVAPYSYFDYLTNSSTATGTIEIALESMLSRTLKTKILVTSPNSTLRVRFSGNQGSFENMPATVNSYLQSNVVGSYLVVSCIDSVNNIWRVLEMFGRWTDSITTIYRQPTLQMSRSIVNSNPNDLPPQSSTTTATTLDGLKADYNVFVGQYNLLRSVVQVMQNILNAKMQADRDSGQQKPLP